MNQKTQDPRQSVHKNAIILSRLMLIWLMTVLPSCQEKEAVSTASESTTPSASNEPSKDSEKPLPVPTETSATVDSLPTKVAEPLPNSPERMPDEAANRLPIALYLANQTRHVDQKLVFRVTAESGNYFNCYYKNRRQSYHHLRLRGDGSAYLDGYLPRDPAGERLFTELQKRKRKLTVTVIARTATNSSVCAGQVEIIDFQRGFNFSSDDTGEPGAFERRIVNQKDNEPARNRPQISHYLDRRQAYIDAPRSFRVRARLDRYFQCKYASSQRSHYALFLQGDGYKGLRAYLPRSTNADALARWLAVNEGAKMTVTVTVKKERFDELCPDQVEVIDWEKGWSSKR